MNLWRRSKPRRRASPRTASRRSAADYDAAAAGRRCGRGEEPARAAAGRGRYSVPGRRDRDARAEAEPEAEAARASADAAGAARRRGKKKNAPEENEPRAPEPAARGLRDPSLGAGGGGGGGGPGRMRSRRRREMRTMRTRTWSALSNRSSERPQLRSFLIVQSSRSVFHRALALFAPPRGHRHVSSPRGSLGALPAPPRLPAALSAHPSAPLRPPARALSAARVRSRICAGVRSGCMPVRRHHGRGRHLAHACSPVWFWLNLPRTVFVPAPAWRPVAPRAQVEAHRRGRAVRAGEAPPAGWGTRRTAALTGACCMYSPGSPAGRR